MNVSTTPIVLLHGWGFTAAVWSLVVDALVQANINHARLQTPPLPLEPDASFTSMLDALAALIPVRSHLVGWSLGGEFALAFAQAKPERVASLTMISSTPNFMNHDAWTAGQPTALLDDFDERLTTNPAALLKRFSMLVRHGDTDASRDRALADILSQAQETDTDRLRAGLQCLRNIDLRDAVPDLNVVCQLIHGTHDAVVPAAAASWLQQQTFATLQLIDGASHALPFTHTEQVAQHLAHFIGGHA